MIKNILLLALFLPSIVFANLSDFFGNSSSSIGFSGIGSANSYESGNNYYIPSVLAFAKEVTAEYTIFVIQHNFSQINNIVTKNSTNNSDTPITDYGSISTDYEDLTGHSINFVLPLKSANLGAVGISYTGPAKNLSETSSGHPFNTEYVMYRARYRRATIRTNYAHPLTEKFAISLGLFMGYQIAADVETNMSLNGNDYGSNAYTKTKVSPSFGAIVSTAYKTKTHMSYFTYHQEMKSNFSTNTSGLTNNLSVAFDINLESMLFYDPHIFRIGYNYSKKNLELLTSLEYQLWGNYKAPVMHVLHNDGGIISSDDYEQVQTKNILIPKIGAAYKVLDSLKLSIGAGFRPTPIKGDFAGSGNSVDTDKYIYSAGIQYSTKFYGKTTTFGISGQYHNLKEKHITKSDNMENGDSGLKIGAPGYKIGGHVTTISLGTSIRI